MKKKLLLAYFTLGAILTSGLDAMKRKHSEVETTTDATNSNNKVVLGQRPKNIQSIVDEKFKNHETNTYWTLNGSQRYKLLGRNDDVILRALVFKCNAEIVNIVDVGCGNGAWGKNAMEVLLQDENAKQSGKLFRIFSVTGGLECENKTEKKDHVELYQLNQFKIENIDEAFQNRDFDLGGNVHFVISSWTLRHLVDPWGTLNKLYNLLTPSQGILIASGFFFALENDTGTEPNILACPLDNWKVLAQTNAVTLFNHYTANRDLDHFILLRVNNKELGIPLEYTGKTHDLDEAWHCGSKKVCTFIQHFDDEMKCHYETEKSNYNKIIDGCFYYEKNNEESKKLFEQFKELK